MTGARICDSCAARLDGVLHGLRARRGVTAAHWLWAPAAGDDGHVLVGSDTLVVHPDPRTSGGAVRARPTALPLRSGSVAALVVGPVLPELPDTDGVFAEFRRVLRPHGLLAMAVPVGPSLGLRGRRLRARVREGWTHRSAVDHPDWLLTAADFAVLGDDRLAFRTDVPPDGAASHVDGLCTAGLLPRGLPAGARAELAAHASVRDGAVTLRRVVARR